MIRWLMSITDAGTISAVRSSAGASCGSIPICSVSAANRPAMSPATSQRRRTEGGVPSPRGNRWISHSIGHPSAKPTTGTANSMR